MSGEARSGSSLWRPVAFFVLMIGLGLRLDTAWQGVGWLLIVAGGVGGGLALRPLVGGGAAHDSPSAFVPPEGRR
jgi:hypothetical protein